MAIATSNPGADLNSPITSCEVLDPIPFAHGYTGCTENPTHVIVNTRAPGYIPVCTRHKEKFQREAPAATVRYLTLADFETERASGLYK